jgi:hypothetical protein
MFRGLMLVAASLCVALSGLNAQGGIVMFNDGSFSYQGYMEENGAPANGMYSFRFEAFLNPTGPEISSDLFFLSDPVPVVDGLFVVNVQMGGSLANAREFWKTVGNQVMYLEIGVGMFKGGPYETLGTRVPMGWGARAQYSVFSEGLIFPYADSFTDEFFDPTTMVSLTSVAGGSVLEAIAGNNENPPIIAVSSATPYGLDFGIQNGGVHVDAEGRPVGLLSISDQYAVVGLLASDNGGQVSSFLGQVSTGVSGADSFQGLNFNGGNFVYLAGDEYAGDFDGDVLVRDSMRVRGDAERDYALNSPSPIGPLAYASINSGGSVSAGTANVSSVWDPANERYEITIAGESVSFQTHVIIANVVDLNSPRVATVNAAGNLVFVKIWNLNATNQAIQDNFHLVVYDPGVQVLNRGASPGGVDLDKYIEQTGDVMIQTAPRHEPVEDRVPVPVGQ